MNSIVRYCPKRILAQSIATILGITILAVAPLKADSLTVRPLAYGGGIGYVSAFHDADFRALPNVPNCCPNFTSGSGGGFEFWLFGELPIAQSFWLGGRLAFSHHSAAFAIGEQTTVIVGDHTEEITFTHSLDVTLSRIGVEPYFRFRLGGFGATAGIRVGTTMAPTYEQRETISPGTFGDGRNVRNQFTGTLQDASTLFADLTAGVSYNIPLNSRKTVFLVPGVRVNYGITPIVSGYNWSTSLVTTGISLRFEPKPSEIVPVSPQPQPPPPPPPPKERPAPTPITRINASFDIAAVSETNIADNVFRVEEFISTQMYPLLNYLFFDEDNADIPQRYNTSGAVATDQSSELAAYYNLLNIIGQRMQQKPNARITVTGCNADAGREKSDIRLSRNRATSVKNYLTSKWNISPERVRIEARGLPERASNPDRPEGADENRRVEIVADDEQILAPLYVRDTVRELPHSIRVRPTVTNAGAIQRWEFTIEQDGRELAGWKARFAPPAELTINSRQTDLREVSGSDPLTCTFTAFGADNNQLALAASEMPVEYVTLEQKRSVRAADKEIERFRLMLFDFDESEPGTANRKTIREITTRITPQSTVKIIGATDAGGDPDYNKRLSLARAQAVSRILGNNRASVEGAGVAGGEFDNTLPEARFYNRNVTVEIVSPAKR